MSYILDALKKSEKERQNGTVPNLMTVQDIMAQKPRKSLLWPYLLLVALLLNAGILAWWLSPWQSKKTEIVAQSTTVSQHVSNLSGSAHDVTNIRLPETAPSHNIGKTVNTDINPEPDLRQNHHVQAKGNLKGNVPNKPAQTIEMSRQSENPPILSKQTSSANYFPDKWQNTTLNSTTAENRIFNLKDLPLSVQESLPPFSISIFIYSKDPADRMVKINGQMLREGQDLAEGLKLKEIVQNGVIFTYKNYCFRVGLK